VVQAVASALEHERPIGFLGLMRNRNYALLWWGQLVSEMGNRFHWIAVSLWVYKLAGSALAVSFAIASMFAGTLIVGLLAGVLVDRLNRKAILVVSDFARAILVALIPFLIHIDIALVYVDLVLVSVATAFFRPAMFGIIPAAVSRKDLMPANSFFSAMDSGTEIFGPVLAGVLAVSYGYASLLYIDSATYVVSGLCALAMSIRPKSRAPEGKTVQTLMGGLIDGLRYIRRDRLQWGLFMLIFPAYLVGSGLNSLQTPLAKRVVGITDAQFGTFNGIWGVGFTVASLVLGWFGSRVRMSFIILGGFFLHFLSTGVMGLSKSFEFLMVTAFMVGFANTLYAVGLSTVLMDHTPAELIGRMVSTRQVAQGFVRIVAPLLFGAIADVIGNRVSPNVGIRISMVMMAAVGALGTTLVVIIHPSIRKFDSKGRRFGEQLFAALKPVIGGVIPEFEVARQRWMSLVSLAIVSAGWLRLLYQSPVRAVGVLSAVLILGLVGSAIHERKWLQGGRR
jgi:MFS family permease